MIDDIKIGNDLYVRRSPDGSHGERFCLRIYDGGSHGSGALLTVEMVQVLHEEIESFLLSKGSLP